MSLIDDKWELLFDRYKIAEKVSMSGLFSITADQIREFKEPRLMTKFDTRESLPKVFGQKLGILPVTRGSYVIGEFDLYQDFPEEHPADSSGRKITRFSIPDWFETIDMTDIRSEASAIHVMDIAGILNHFLDENGFHQTVSGRMASGQFDFYVNPFRSADSLIPPAFDNHIFVTNSQIEIDGGFEAREAFTILEAKNVVHSNFLVRQLYYPYRLWESRLRKRIRPVFLVYSNHIFRLLEYEFTDLKNYNSIRLVQERRYSLEDTEITPQALWDVCKQTRIQPEPEVTFIQADSFDKVISLTEQLKDCPLSAAEIAERFGFRERQSDYYYNACRYLGLAEKKKDADGIVRVCLTKQGRDLLKLRYKPRQLAFVRLILEHRIFHELFEETMQCGFLPGKQRICQKMQELEVCGPNLITRRASSVAGWLRWMVDLSK